MAVLRYPFLLQEQGQILPQMQNNPSVLCPEPRSRLQPVVS